MAQTDRNVDSRVWEEFRQRWSEILLPIVIAATLIMSALLVIKILDERKDHSADPHLTPVIQTGPPSRP